jgi:hypothetical protein
MAYKIGDIVFEGMNGTMQKAKPSIETYTRLGDNKVWIQKINTSSNQSTLSCWQMFADLVTLDTTIQNLKKIVGKQSAIEQEGVIISSCYVIDFTYTINKVAGCSPYILRVEIIAIADERATQ